MPSQIGWESLGPVLLLQRGHEGEDPAIEPGVGGGRGIGFLVGESDDLAEVLKEAPDRGVIRVQQGRALAVLGGGDRHGGDELGLPDQRREAPLR